MIDDTLNEQGKLPNAYYRIEDLEAQKFVRKCLENVSKRLPATELLLHPFLASDNVSHEEELPATPPLISHPPKETAIPVPRRTDMTISGSMNPEDDTVFLKVRIKVKGGKYH